MPVISFLGNKGLLINGMLIMISVMSAAGMLLASKRSRLRLEEKQMLVVHEDLESWNSEMLRNMEYEID